MVRFSVESIDRWQSPLIFISIRVGLPPQAVNILFYIFVESDLGALHMIFAVNRIDLSLNTLHYLSDCSEAFTQINCSFT